MADTTDAQLDKPAREACANCTFFLLDEGTAQGQCRRYPPEFVRPQESHHPKVSRNGWCGEHEPGEPGVRAKWQRPQPKYMQQQQQRGTR